MLKDYIIVRTCWVFGGGPGKDHKFVGKIMSRSDKHKLYALSDTHGSPTYAKDLVDKILELVSKKFAGIIHVANSGSANRYDMARLITKLTTPKTKVTKVKSTFFNLPAERSKNESIVSETIKMRPWQEALEEYIKTEWDFDPKKVGNK